MALPSNLYEIPMPQAFLPSRFFMTFGPSLAKAAHSNCGPLRDVSCCSIRNTSSTLVGWRRSFVAPRRSTPELISDVIAQSVRPLRRTRDAAKSRIDRLIESGAWTDAALALVELELPQWKLRRIVYEEGEWHCCLSRHPQLPLGLDDVAEASHEILPLALLISLLQARRAVAERPTGVTAVPQVGPVSGYAVCCDNFA